ncbi:MAG: cytosolic protein [Deltaproteobacteria bacterium]|nr:cytosolic protein [Deltaproteobacteria bacterium]
MDGSIGRPEDLNTDELAGLVMDLVHRIAVHHTLWFREAEHQFGLDRALLIMDEAWEKSLTIQMNRLAATLGFEMKQGLPAALLSQPREKLLALIDALSLNWLANDGLWFQAVESRYGMFDAKRTNDTCWTRFSPFEAHSIKRFLELPQEAGIDGLETALQFRMYARINKQTLHRENEETLALYMNDCRVQGARKRKGLEDYPCKSAGVVEYRTFAEGVDRRIATECIGCPPDGHPADWFCAWRFRLKAS